MHRGEFLRLKEDFENLLTIETYKDSLTNIINDYPEFRAKTLEDVREILSDRQRTSEFAIQGRLAITDS